MSHVRVLLLLFLLVFIALSTQALPPDDQAVTAEYKIMDNTTFIDDNLILMFVTNHGNFGRDLSGLFGYDYGTFYPFTDIASIQNGTNTTSPLYAAGLWIGGLVDGQIRLAIAEYDDEFVPGPMSDGTFQSDRPEFKVYKLYRDSLAGNPNSDYLNWPVDQGAPLDESGNPLMLGDQMLWSVYNDANLSHHMNNAGSTSPLGVEIQQTVWASHISSTPQDNLIWIQYKLYNRGGNTIQDFYISLWSDPDLGGAGDDLVGCDTLAGSFFCYNATNSDLQYGSTPPVTGFKMLFGPVVPSVNDTGYFDGHQVPGFKNLTMSSFQLYINGTDPDYSVETYNYMRGLTRDGLPLPNGTKYAVPGDPVSCTGELDTNPKDKRMMGTFGPITFNPGDSQYVLIKMAVGTGTDRLNSIEVVKEYLEYGQAPLPIVMKANIDPEPVRQVMLNSIEPMDICVNLGYDENGNFGKEFDYSTLCVNSLCSFDSIHTATSAPGFTGNVTQLYIPVTDFLEHYGLLWDSASYPYTITGQYTDGEPFTFEGQVAMIGHRSGDFNLDYAIDISDLVAMVEFFFADGAAPDYVRAADMNGDAQVDIGDLVRLVEYMF